MSTAVEAPFVNFMLIGVQKAGTTALAHFLAEHPRIYLPAAKELHIFDDGDWPGVQSVAQVNAAYQLQMGDHAGQPLVGDATPSYLWLPGVVEDIARYNPGMKLIVLLREPRARALSHYRMEVARGKERLPLVLALLAEPWRLWRDRGNRSRWAPSRYHSYVSRSRYARQLRHLYRHFPREQVLVLRGEDLLRHHAETLDRAFGFLGVEPRGALVPPAVHREGSGDSGRERLGRGLLRLLLWLEPHRLRGLVPFDPLDWRSP
jgi:hypothetical protein